MIAWTGEYLVLAQSGSGEPTLSIHSRAFEKWIGLLFVLGAIEVGVGIVYVLNPFGREVSRSKSCWWVRVFGCLAPWPTAKGSGLRRARTPQSRCRTGHGR